MEFLSTLSLRRATLSYLCRYLEGLEISIHALLAESDTRIGTACVAHLVISIHALLAESDLESLYSCQAVEYFYPRSPCGERPGNGGKIIGGANISIHALLAESDRQRRPKPVRNPPFLSTLSLRRATRPVQAATLLPRKFLSTLSLRRATQAIPRFFLPSNHFYPRSPCGERPAGGRSSPITETFLSTLSLRRATVHVTEHASPCRISIHALLAESDQRGGVLVRQPEIFLSTLSLRRATRGPEARIRPVIYFYPRSPCGERPSALCVRHGLDKISIHALLAESDVYI